MLTRTENTQLKLHLVTMEDLVPADHFLRKLDHLVDISFIYQETQTYYRKNI